MNKTIRFSLLMLLVMLCGTVYADAYTVDFNTAITTSSHDFKVASNWKHIVHRYNDGYFDYWMSYSYGATTGVNGSGALYAGEQRAGDNTDNEVTYDMLVTPVVSGDVTIYVKKNSYGTPFIEFWSLNETGTAKNVKLHEVKTFEANAWVAVTYQVATPQRIGIRAQYLYLDNFSATNAVIEPEKSISITSAEPSATNGTIYWDQQANGKVKVSYRVTVTNNGEVDLTQGTPNYSISVFNRKTNEVYFTVPVPQDLAIGANSEPFEVAGEVEPTTWTNSYTYINMDLKENLQGSIVQRAQSHYKAYEPKFIFRVAESTSTSSLNSTQAYGLISEATTRKFEIRNDGTAPLIIKSISLPEGFTSDNKPEIPEGGYTIAKNTALPLNITLPVDARGNFSGDLTIVYLDKDGAEQTYALGFSGNVLAANTWYVDFDNTKSSILFAEGSVAESGIRYDYSYDAGLYNYYLYSYTSDSYANANNKFITPKLHASAGDKLVFDVRRDNSGDEKYNLKVYVSTDRQTWGEPKFTVSAANLTSAFQTKEITFDEEGDYYVAFAVYGVRIDNVIGLTKVDVAHDLYIKSVSWPDASIKSGASQSKPTVDIIPLTNEAAENYTVKYVSGETVLAEGTPVALTASATSSKTFNFSWTPQVESTTKYVGSKIVFEFTDGTKFETEGFDLTVTNEPIFHFVSTLPSSKHNEPTDHTTPVAFGKTNTADKKTFYVYNWGSAPLTVKSIVAPEGFTATPAEQFTVAAFDENNLSAAAQPVEITFSATHPATYNGDMVITYIDGTGAEKTFTLPISGTKLDPAKYYANFDDQNWPAGSVYQKNIEMINGGTYSEPNYHITASSSTDNIFITPKLTAAIDDTLKFDAKLYNSNWADGKIVVYAAATREEILDFDPENDTRKPLFSVSGKDIEYPIISDYRTFKVPVNVAGDYYFGFEISGRPYVDEIYGLEPTAVAHDLKIASSSIPADGMQNVEYQANVNILNYGLTEEAADGYTMTVYVDNKAVATGTTVAIPVSHKPSDVGTKVSATFRYPKVGTFPVYVEVKAGEFSVATEPVDVVFAEEVASSNADMAGNGTTGEVPLYLNYKNSESITLYNAETLAGIGLANGSKISSITYKGYKISEDQTTSFQVYYKWTDNQTLEQPATDYPYAAADNGMTSLIDEDHTWTAVGSSSELGDMLVLNFSEPLVYEAGKSLCIYMHSYVDGYKAAYFEKSTLSSDFCYARKQDAATLSSGWSKTTPAAVHFALVAEATTISGTVKNSEGAAIENATVTLVSADGANVQYEGKTNAEGAYSFNVIQTGRTYNATVVATENYKTATAEISFSEGSVTKDFVLDDVIPLGDANLDGEVTTSDAVTAVAFALEKETPSEKALKKADVNKSGTITVSDAVAIVNIARNTPQSNTGATAASLTVADASLVPGKTKVVSISLDAAEGQTIYGIQTDITLSKGLKINAATAANTALHFNQNKLESGATRVALLSLGGEAIPAGEAIKLTIEADASFKNGTIDLANTKLTTTATGTEINVDATRAIIDTYDCFPYQKYIIGNYTTEKFLGAGNGWGTQASLVTHPEYVKLDYNEADGTYKLESQVSNGGNKYYFNGDYMDSNAPVSLTLKKIEEPLGYQDEEETKPIFGYTISDGDNYYGWDGTSTVLGKNLSATDENAIWLIMPLDEAKAGLVNATLEEPLDATMLIEDHDFGRNNRYQDKWTMVASNQKLSGGEDNNGTIGNNCAESWHSTFTLSQTLADAPAGIYALTAQGFYGQDGSDNEHLPVFYANDATQTFPLKAGDEASMTAASQSFSAGKYTIEPLVFELKEGETLTIGAKLEGNTALWCIWDNFVLTYYGKNTTIEDVKAESLRKQVDDLREKAFSLFNETEIESIKAVLENAINSTESVSGAEAINNAIATLKAAIEKGEVSLSAKAKLDKMKELIDATNVYTAEAKAEYYDQWVVKYTDGSITKAEVNALQDPFLTTGWCANTTVDNFLLSAWDTNPDFQDAAYYINTWSTEGDNDGSNFKVPFFEYFGNPLPAKTLTATMNGLEPGNYDVTAWVRVAPADKTATSAKGVTLQVNEGDSVNVCTGEQFDCDAERFFIKEYTATGVVAEDGVLKIQFHVAENNDIHWLSFKNVKFEKVEEQFNEYKYEGYVAIATTVQGNVQSPVTTAPQTLTITETETEGTVKIGFSGFTATLPPTAFPAFDFYATKAENPQSYTSVEGSKISWEDGMIRTFNINATGTQKDIETTPRFVLNLFQNPMMLIYVVFAATEDEAKEHITIATGIQNVKTDANSKTIYNLNGQKVNKAQKGLNIINGKKVVIR